MPPPDARHPELLAYRSEFPLLEASVYLNTCSLGARSERSRRRLDAFLADWDELGARAWYRRWLGELDDLRADFGAIVGVPGDEISLAPNVSTALAVIASALDPIHRGDRAALERFEASGLAIGSTQRRRVVTTALDFPTIGHQWLARAPLGVELVVVPSTDGMTVPLDAFAAAIDERTALVATGQVLFTTGAVNDTTALAALCHQRGALLLVDAYQATGILPTDLAASGVDIYVSGTLKWLFGGPGMAFLRVRPELLDALVPTTTGWFSSARQFAFAVDALELAADGRRYELGTPSVPSAALARGGTELVREIGVERLGERTRDLGQLLIGLADEAGLTVRAVRDPDRRGGIVAIAVADPKPVVDALAAESIIVDYRPGIVRCSPAFYNTEDEVRLLVARLAAHVPGVGGAVS
ncbi:MAG TPA: aminotransferase class V-fold PLP-dependent enzyme [Candidatus Limnocylindrales bacterium]|nr:aminotransferase class V-fold PLP-dependent enzyme [Candidatus Limnocylindrales bacterium]